MFHKVSDIECALYRNKTTKEVVVAFRGTDSSTDFAIDITPAALNSQVKDAKHFMKILQNNAEDLGINFNAIVMTGHSLGGYLVQQISKETGLKGYAFNPKAAGIKGQKYDVPVVNIRVGFDQWTGITDEFWGKDIGKTFFIPGTFGHKLKNLIPAINNQELIKLAHITSKLGGVDKFILKLKNELGAYKK